MRTKDSSFFFFILLVFLLSSCGIEDYYFLYSVPQGNIQVTLNNRAIIQLPSLSAEYYYFTNFTIFYRLYISGSQESGAIQTSPASLSSINSYLSSDYLAIEPYTKSDTTVSATTGSLFKGRNFYKLELENANIDDILSSEVMGQTLIIDFPVTGVRPFLSIGGSSRTLYRSTGEGSFNPVPNRYFLNTSELNSSSNVSSTVNADVANKNDISGSRFTYAAMYIVVTGIDSNFTPIYSAPTFINIFALPNP
ncbi:MAG: hypothetical protein LBE10_01185 [Treponema sp.]|jgi:hypothetical protein|nr:hypothetical protein [Treponema sp.]